MTPSVTDRREIESVQAFSTREREHLFYTGMAIAIAITAFAGFARSYYLRLYFGAPPLAPLLHFHGFVFTTWLILFVTQTTLVAKNRVGVHRRLGVLGGGLAALLVVVGTVTAIIRAGQGAAPTGVPPLVFLAIPLTDMAVFAGLIGAGFYFRRRPDMHKRLMLLATIALLAAPIARLPFGILQAGPPAFFGLADLFLLPCFIYDKVARGRIHPATVWGSLVIVASQPLRLMLGGTAAWLAFASWLTR
jgi:hypothetical protein